MSMKPIYPPRPRLALALSAETGGSQKPMCIFRRIVEWFRRSTVRADIGPIRHVIVLMLENHSFDQMLGSFKSVFPDLEGVDPANPGINRDNDGRVYPQAATTATSVTHDPMHELANVLHQLEKRQRRLRARLLGGVSCYDPG